MNIVLGDGLVLVENLNVDNVGSRRLALEELLSLDGRNTGVTVGVDVRLEGLGSSGHVEANGLNVGVLDSLVGSHNLVALDVESPLGHEGNASLGVCALVLGQLEEVVVAVLVVSDVSISLAGQEQGLGVVVEEGHADTGGRV